MEKLVAMLRAAGDPTRLRLLLLLRQAELTVSELTDIVGQSQPRVSRHLKQLCDAGLNRTLQGRKLGILPRRRYRARRGAEPVVVDSRVGRSRPETPERRAASSAPQKPPPISKPMPRNGNSIRSLQRPRQRCEAAVARLLAHTPIENLLDAGTGTGRMLELLSSQAKRAVGIDVSPEMLAIARDRLMQSGLTQCQVRLGDTYRLPFSRWRRADRFRRRAVSSGAALSRRSGRCRGRSGAGDAPEWTLADCGFRLA